MIHEVHGDITLTAATAIAHGVAPNDHFNAGLALQLRERFPAMFKDFRHYGQISHPKPGDIWVWSGMGPTGPVHIVSLFTQQGGYEHGAKPGRATLDNVNHSLRKLGKWVGEQGPASLALPRLATGVGGLDWKDVEPLIREHLRMLPIPVILYSTFRKGERADEAPAFGAPRTARA